MHEEKKGIGFPGRSNIMKVYIVTFVGSFIIGGLVSLIMVRGTITRLSEYKQ